MEESFHYLSMANQMLIQKKLMENVKSTGLTLGQPKVLDYLKHHDGANQKEIAAGCHIEWKSEKLSHFSYRSGKRIHQNNI